MAAGRKTVEGGDGAPAGEEPTFEQALQELEAIVQKLERGQLDLESSIAAYERGTELRRRCEVKLGEARLRVEKLTFDREGQPAGSEPFDPS
ncbi:MAG: exodeoxyribonuclease VII small subunit [Geminicoccaceae bacterium]|nr:exodeoxyribonuclease VII small subunit [Geminicoccaceae bacterium]